MNVVRGLRVSDLGVESSAPGLGVLGTEDVPGTGCVLGTYRTMDVHWDGLGTGCALGTYRTMDVLFPGCVRVTDWALDVH